MSEIFSNILKGLRRQNSITQKELASELDVSQNTVYQWENGYEPSMDKLLAIADYFDVPIEVLFGERRVPATSGEMEFEILFTLERLTKTNKAKLLGYGKGLLESQSETEKKLGLLESQSEAEKN